MVTTSDMSAVIEELFIILDYEFNAMGTTFSMLDVVLCMGGFLVISTAIRKLFLFFIDGRR